MTILEKYNSTVKDWENNGGEILIYSFGLESAEKLMEEALSLKCVASVKYDYSAVDKIEAVLFISNETNETIKTLKYEE